MRFKTMLLIIAVFALIASPVLAKDFAKTSYPNNMNSQSRDYLEGFEDAFPPVDWTVNSVSGHLAADLENWYHNDLSVFEGLYAAACDYDPDLIPQDNEMFFDHAVIAGEEHLNFQISGSAYWSTNYDVTVEINGTQVYSWAATYGETNWVYENHDIDVTAYVGQTITVLFRYAGNDGAAIYLDNVAFNSGVVIPDPPENDTCEGAIVIPAGDFNLAGDMTYANNDYDPAVAGCTGYSAAGLDITYSFTLAAGATFDVSVTGEHDGSIYLVTDCADIDNTCVIGADDTLSGDAEVISYLNDGAEAMDLFLIVDAYSGGGPVTVVGTNGIQVPTEDMNLSSVKTLY